MSVRTNTNIHMLSMFLVFLGVGGLLIKLIYLLAWSTIFHRTARKKKLLHVSTVWLLLDKRASEIGTT